MAGTIKEPTLFGNYISVGDYVNVRCQVTAVSSVGPLGGCGDTVTLLVETPGNVGEQHGVSFQCSPIQCRKAGNADQA